jgi:hypothetical protein
LSLPLIPMRQSRPIEKGRRGAAYGRVATVLT